MLNQDRQMDPNGAHSINRFFLYYKCIIIFILFDIYCQTSKSVPIHSDIIISTLSGNSTLATSSWITCIQSSSPLSLIMSFDTDAISLLSTANTYRLHTHTQVDCFNCCIETFLAFPYFAHNRLRIPVPLPTSSTVY